MDIQSLHNQLEHCMLRDVFRFRRRLQALKKTRSAQQDKLEKLSREIEQSIAMTTVRRQNLPVVSYPEDLPIAQKQELIKKTIQENQVTILCGETGSGKTTQLPKICLDIGLGVRGKIGHTQPRRLAARAVSQRIAEELELEAGNQVAYKVRFSDQSDDSSYIKLMTDGILLAECNHDPFLNQYDTIIIDEAHERSLNIDFLLGYLKRLIRKRKDLKVIITSATIDPDMFARHFDNAPVINVSGRTYPVEVRYRPFMSADSESKKDMQDGIIDAVTELSKESRGDILVFLSGERDIRETQDALNREMQRSSNRHTWDNTEVLPLLARLSNAEQNRIFHPCGKRRIVLATNVAETSLTVPGIKYVIDSGLARISRYSWRSKIQRLPIEKISQASANQRKGRCGRLSDGVCIRLYDEEDFTQRAEFTEPEIQRTNLAAVILQMENQRLGHIDDFPFVEPPEQRLINDGYRLLFELGAIDNSNRVTASGKQIARLPIDPRLARMLIQASDEGALNEVLIIVSALATQDPRERPLDRQQQADEKHAVFRDKASDFIFYINLWNAYFEQKQLLSNNQLRKWCKQNFIAWMRMREWIDTHHQICSMLKQSKICSGENAADYDAIHQSLLTGLLANTGFKQEEKEFLGARNKKFTVFPGSTLFKSPPKWMMSAEIVETTRVYARTNAKIDVAWIGRHAKHLLKYHYSNPHWEKKRAQVVASEQSTLYGLIINPDRKVNYARIDPRVAREIFIRDALIRGDLVSKAGFYQHNRELVERLEALEAKSRRRDIVVDEQVLFEFYDRHLPQDVHSGAALDKWSRHHTEATKKLFLKEEDLVRDDAGQVCDDQFPDTITLDGSRYPVEYHFDPGNHCDGITLVTPVAGLAALNPQRCEWLIPGLLLEKMTALIRSLPKQLRKNFVPAPDFARTCHEALQPCDRSLCTEMALHLKKITGVQIPYDAWDMESLPTHLAMNFRVIDREGKTTLQGRDLSALQQQLAGSHETMPDETVTAQTQYGQDDVGAEVIGTLEEEIELEMQGVCIKAFPSLVVEGKQVNVRALENQRVAEYETHRALRQLVVNRLRVQFKQLRASLPDIDKLCLKYRDLGSCEQLKSELVDIIIDELFLSEPIGSHDEFESRIEQGKAGLYDAAERWSRLLGDILDEYRAVKKQMKNPGLSQLDTVADIQLQLNHLFTKDFISHTDKQWLQQYPRYLKAINMRLDKSAHNMSRDRQLRIDFSGLWEAYTKRNERMQQAHTESGQLNHYRWMLEEYRVSLFAQELKTRFPVSEKRLKTFWNDISDT